MTGEAAICSPVAFVFGVALSTLSCARTLAIPRPVFRACSIRYKGAHDGDSLTALVGCYMIIPLYFLCDIRSGRSVFQFETRCKCMPYAGRRPAACRGGMKEEDGGRRSSGFGLSSVLILSASVFQSRNPPPRPLRDPTATFVTQG